MNALINKYGLQERKITIQKFTPSYGEIMIASQDSKGAIVMINESKGKKITNISEDQNIVTALHPEQQDYLEYNGQQLQSIDQLVLSLEGNKISQIRSGKEHNIVLTESGTLYSFGKGNFGSLGLGGVIFAPSPYPITKISNKIIISVACGLYHSLALSNIGDVYSWGRGFQGQLALLEGVQSASSPTLIPHFFKYGQQKGAKLLKKTQIISIACGSYHSLAIDEHKSVYCWGQARYGQTGNGKKSKQTIPVKIPLQTDGQQCLAKSLIGGFGHTMCLTTQGQIFVWGLNIKGQLGINDLPENIKTNQNALKYTKAVYYPVKLQKARDQSPLPKFTSISCGFTSSYALDESGKAWGWGGGNLGIKDVFLQRGPTLIKQNQDKKFTHLYANQNSLILFCPFTPLYFKPGLVSSAGKSQLTFFGNGFTETGKQSVKFMIGGQTIEMKIGYDEKTSTFYCKVPNFEKYNKKLQKLDYPALCSIEVSLDQKQYLSFPKKLLVYSSKMQIQSMQPNCGSVLGGSLVKLYMPLPKLVTEYVNNITVGFKSSNGPKKEQNRTQNNADWICCEGVYDNQVISCKIPNIPHFDHDNPFYMLDVSLNNYQFTQQPHTFRYYFINQTHITPNQGQDNQEPQCIISGQGLFDTPNKQLKIQLKFNFNDRVIDCVRVVDPKWNKQDKTFTLKMPKLSWIIGDHEITPQLLQEARKHPCLINLYVSKQDKVEIGRYLFKIPPPPPQPQQDKKDAKKDAKKGAKK